jgi:hypothetical protein
MIKILQISREVVSLFFRKGILVIFYKFIRI